MDIAVYSGSTDSQKLIKMASLTRGPTCTFVVAPSMDPSGEGVIIKVLDANNQYILVSGATLTVDIELPKTQKLVLQSQIHQLQMQVRQQEQQLLEYEQQHGKLLQLSQLPHHHQHKLELGIQKEQKLLKEDHHHHHQQQHHNHKTPPLKSHPSASDHVSKNDHSKPEAVQHDLRNRTTTTTVATKPPKGVAKTSVTSKAARSPPSSRLRGSHPQLAPLARTRKQQLGKQLDPAHTKPESQSTRAKRPHHDIIGDGDKVERRESKSHKTDTVSKPTTKAAAKRSPKNHEQTKKKAEKEDGQGDESVRIIVMTPLNCSHSFKIKRSTKISDLKGLISNKEDVHPDQQRLVFNGQVLQDNRTLSDYNIVEYMSTIDLEIIS
ncbi:hypothetical protein BGZ83_011501 [Gryganskiella cystojenkinii]|nr:hypothetical protein BGZ83_011501 [Gryganskiella cystojenkinii]